MRKTSQKTYLAIFGVGLSLVILLSLFSNLGLSQPPSGGAVEG